MPPSEKCLPCSQTQLAVREPFASRLNAPNIRPGAARFLTPSSCGLLTEGADLCPHIKSEASGMSPGALKGRSGWGPGVIRGRGPGPFVDSTWGPSRQLPGCWGLGLPQTINLSLSFQEQFCF